MNEHKEGEGDNDHTEKVRRRAYAIWLDQGQVHGRDQEHWHEAEREVSAEEARGLAPAEAGSEPKPSGEKPQLAAPSGDKAARESKKP